MEIMGKVMLLGIIFLVIAGIIWGYYHVKNHHKQMMDYYNNIKIGDRFFFTQWPEHPFGEPVKHYATIINKKIAGGNHPWVQYRYDDGSVGQDELHDFLTFHEKVSD